MPVSRKYPSINEAVFPLPPNKSGEEDKRSPKEKPVSNPNVETKNNDHFMAMACLASLRSKDPSKKAYMHAYMHVLCKL